MSVNSWIRRQFKNAVSISDYVPAGFNSVATSFVAHDGSTFPDGSIGPFTVTVDEGLSTEEKVQIATRSGSLFTVNTNGRGYNGTTPQNHGTNASILHTIDAQDMDEANQVAVQTLGAIQATGDLLVGNGANMLTRLARGANTQFLQASPSSVAWVSFGSGGAQGVASSTADGTSTLPARYDHTHQGVISVNGSFGVVVSVATFNGRTGAVTLSANDVSNIMAAAGNLIVGTGAGTGEQLTIGAAGTVLTVGGLDPSGLEWAVPTDTLIASQTLSSPAASITFSSIPATFNHLRLVIVSRSTASATSDILVAQFNGDTGPHYDVQQIEGQGGSATAPSTSGGTVANFGLIPANNNTAGEAAYTTIDIPLYAGTTWRKQAISNTGLNDAQQIAIDMTVATNKWRNTAAINSIKIFANTGPNLATGTAAFLYGIN